MCHTAAQKQSLHPECMKLCKSVMVFQTNNKVQIFLASTSENSSSQQ